MPTSPGHRRVTPHFLFRFANVRAAIRGLTPHHFRIALITESPRYGTSHT